MAMTVNTNVSALVAQRHLNSASEMLNQSLERLSSGNRINSAKDDAAGLQISNRLETQMRGLGIAVRNANDGISIMQTARGDAGNHSAIATHARPLFAIGQRFKQCSRKSRITRGNGRFKR